MVWNESGSGTGIGFRERCRAKTRSRGSPIRSKGRRTETRWSQRINPAAWPECSTHRTHPLEPKADSGVAMWTCPKDTTISVAIGFARLTVVPSPCLTAGKQRSRAVSSGQPDQR